MVAERARLRKSQRKLDPRRLVFIDETGFKTNMTRSRGRSRVGTRLIDKTPHGHWCSTTLVAALRSAGMRAPMTLDGAMNGELFRGWVEQFLAPSLKRGDIVFMDNLPSHKVPGVEEAIRARGAHLRYLPKYSPDLNPIEMAFSKLKSFIRAARPRTMKKLWRDIAAAINQITPRQGRAFLAHAGYSN